MTRKAAPAAEAGLRDPSRLFRPLAGRSGLVLAVSGGADSTALMLLVARWNERPPVLVVSVDHGLRPEAAAEAQLVADNAARLGLPVRITRAQGRPEGNLQDWARRARYACLAQAAKDVGFDTVVTAHHRDDQAETFLLRLARGSGVYGLAAMRESEELCGDLLLARPLLGVPRAALQKVAEESGLRTTSDPSNKDDRFDRVRMRALMPVLATHGLDAARLAETAGRLARAAQALEAAATAFLRQHFRADRNAKVIGAVDGFQALPEETALRAIARIVRSVGGADYTPPLASVEALYAAILELRPGGRLKRTLSGAVVSVAAGQIAAWREWGRSGIPDLPVSAGSTIVWDRRFRVVIPECAGTLTVGALGRSGSQFRLSGAGKDVVVALPGLFQDGVLVAAPDGVLPENSGDRLAVLRVECLVGQRLGLSDVPS